MIFGTQPRLYNAATEMMSIYQSMEKSPLGHCYRTINKLNQK